MKVWLLEVSPMVWRRLLVPAVCTLRELHGMIQVAMGWEGFHLYQFHLRTARYSSFELSASSPDVSIDSLKVRTGARFIYEHDLNASWRHEVRIEDRLERDPCKTYPTCLDGHGACPPEDCGGAAAYFEGLDDIFSLEAVDDLDEIIDSVEDVLFKRRPGGLLEALSLGRLREALDRTAARERSRGRPFSRREVNGRFRRDEHHTLMRQQVW